jgi:hypothetical protein
MTYQGWKNYDTWNVSLWINNTETTYRNARWFMSNNPDKNHPYMAFILNQKMTDKVTPDDVEYMSDDLDYDELNAMMRDLME